jgi:hypothetical protein
MGTAAFWVLVPVVCCSPLCAASLWVLLPFGCCCSRDSGPFGFYCFLMLPFVGSPIIWVLPIESYSPMWAADTLWVLPSFGCCRLLGAFTLRLMLPFCGLQLLGADSTHWVLLLFGYYSRLSATALYRYWAFWILLLFNATICGFSHHLGTAYWKLQPHGSCCHAFRAVALWALSPLECSCHLGAPNHRELLPFA